MAQSGYTQEQAQARMRALAASPECNQCGNCGRKFNTRNRPHTIFMAEYENTGTGRVCRPEFLLCWQCFTRAKVGGNGALNRVKQRAEDAAHVLLSPRALIDGHEYAFPFGEDTTPPLSLVNTEENPHAKK